VKVNIDIDTSALKARTLREAKRLAFNTAEALNKTAIHGQQLVREEITQTMTLRSSTKRGKAFVLEQVKVAFASARKGLAFAEVYIAKKARLLLAAFETQEQREGFVGKNVAIPNPEGARVGGNLEGSVKEEFTFKAMKLKKTGHTHHGQPILKGAADTFQVATEKHPLGEVLQRTGPGQDDVRLLYTFAHPFRLKRLLHFKDRLATAMREKFRNEWIIANARDRK
jgi:hypothetical protein